MAHPEHGHPLINLVTGSRLGLAVAVAMLTPWSGDRRWAVIVCTALVVGVELTDLLDGCLARRFNAVSQFGKVFDPYADSVSRLTIYWSLAVVGRALALVPLVMAVRDISVAYLRVVKLSQGGSLWRTLRALPSLAKEAAMRFGIQVLGRRDAGREG